jgi:CARDB
VSAVTLTPPNPAAGQQVSFNALVRNVGGIATPAGVSVGVGYFVDGVYQTWGSVAGPLAAGASISVGTQGAKWNAIPGDHQVTALVDDVNRFPESNEANNTTSSNFSVGPPSPAGNLYAINVDSANPAGNPTAAQLVALGVRWVRIEWKADRAYSLYDPVIAAYRAAGLRVLLLVDYSTVAPKPAWNAGDTAWQNYLPAFIAKVQELAAHYGDGVDAWEIWNEPDLFAPVAGYDPGVPARWFGIMLRDAVEAIRPLSSRPIVAGGLASRDPTYLTSARAAAGTLTVDAVGVHPYEERVPSSYPTPTWGRGNMSDLLDGYLAFGLPLWITEIGINEPTRQADYLQNVFELARDRYGASVPVVFWFCWSDGMVMPFGVVDRNGAQKPAYARFRALAP